jgi:hypothetical protein
MVLLAVVRSSSPEVVQGVAVNLACLKVLSAVAPYEGHRLLLMVDDLSRIVPCQTQKSLCFSCNQGFTFLLTTF